MGNVNGYITVYCPNHHSVLGNSGMVYEHILKPEEKLGRELNKGEVVHHIDKNRSNNDFQNLMVFKTKEDHNRFHSTNIAEKDSDVYISPKISIKCIDCSAEIYRGSTRCPACAKKQQRKVKNRPAPEQLREELIKSNFVQVGKKYGVSDNAIRKWCKNYGMSTKAKDYKGD